MLSIQRMSTTLQTLPIEVICLVFRNLEMHDLLACLQTSKHFHKIIKNSSQLQYIIELGRYHMVSLLPASDGPPFATRLKMLHDREDAWKCMNPRKRATLKLPPTGSIYEFVGGFYGNGREDDRSRTASISFLELPSADSSTTLEGTPKLETWSHSMKDVTIVDFTMDPAQDLLVLVSLAPLGSRYVYELHLRSLKTNQPHPRAPVSILGSLRKLPSHLYSSDVVAGVRVQVSGNLVALLAKEAFEGDHAHLEIWNWESNPHFSCTMVRTDGIDDFTFLTHDSFLLVSPPGQFEVCTFSLSRNHFTTPSRRYTYQLPPLSDGYMYWYISMSSNPAPGYVPQRSDYSNGTKSMHGRQVHYPHPNDRIHSCCLYIFNPSREERHHVHSFVFFVNLNTLMNPPAHWFARTNPLSLQNDSSPIMFRRPTDFLSAMEGSTTQNSSSSLILNGTYSLPVQMNTQSSSSGDSRIPSYPSFPSFDPPGYYHPPGYNFVSIKTQTQILDGVVPWEVWGTHATRWFEECISTDWQHAVYGLRTVDSIEPEKVMREHDMARPHPNGHVNQDNTNGVGGGGFKRKFLRLRNFNPYLFSDVTSASASQPREGKGKGKASWRTPRLVTEPSTTAVTGVFKYDIVSSLAYTEVVSEDTFEVTDVMMDDSRVLLLKRGEAGKLERMDVLMM